MRNKVWKWQKKQRELQGFDKDFLISEYIDKRKSANQIAREIKRDPKRVWEWIKDYGLDTRPRGTDYGQCFKKNHNGCLGRKLSNETKDKIRKARLKDGRVPYLVDGVHWMKKYNRKPS